MNLDFLKQLGLHTHNAGTWIGSQPIEESTGKIDSYSPVDAAHIGSVSVTTQQHYERVIQAAGEAYATWRNVPAPKRGEIVRQYGNLLREYKEPLGKLVSYEMGKIYQEGLGEVQEMIDICDFAVGLSRQLYGLTMHSERSQHRMYEQWHPLGVVGIISAFNFPVAVWSWNAMIAAVCGDVCIWKPSEKTPLSAVACQMLMARVLKENNLPDGLFCLINGEAAVGEFLTKDERVPLISATGSVRMGKIVGQAVAARMGRSLLELGGNNAIIVSQHANLDLALRAITFGAAGTAGQRCTTTRRLIIHSSIYENVKQKLTSIYAQLSIGNPLEGNLVGPLIDKAAVNAYSHAIEQLKKEGGTLVCGGSVMQGKGYESGCYVQPAICEAQPNYSIVQEETFAPILYLLKYDTLEEAIAIQNGVRQGLSSSIFTDNLQEAEHFLSASGSDCGIANVNIGTSGAEIGGAFGGEKETGGGRESGSDSWKAYMRRQTNTINYGKTLPLAQGIEFNVG
ncbi:MAG: aldehyde dehydrogenase family protein [Bacteroidota bacterium]|jgi:aldehyde dehydrogenase (NAD+)